MPMGQLAQVLRGLGSADDARLLVGPDTVDDAGIVLLGAAEGVPGGLALVQTVDYFPPVLDDPYLYGAVAAANSLSDVYAMGGRPVSALNIAGFPRGFDPEWVSAIFRGGFEKVREAGAVVAGGHTVESPEPMFGFAVTGVVEREHLTANAGARPGDVVYLTKPLGMGTMTTAGKQQRVAPERVRAAALVMATLNAPAAAAMNAAGAHAATDVTGYGLLGHARNVARASGVSLRFEAARLPVFEDALELARAGCLSGGSKRGRTTFGAEVRIGADVDRALADICFDAETSGGLLIFLPPERAAALEAELARRGVAVHRVGRVLAQESHVLALE